MRKPTRNVWCPHYAKCLDRAAASKHDRFDCHGCPLEHDTSHRTDNPTDNFALALLASAVLYPSLERRLRKSKKVRRDPKQLRKLLRELDLTPAI